MQEPGRAYHVKQPNSNVAQNNASQTYQSSAIFSPQPVESSAAPWRQQQQQQQHEYQQAPQQYQCQQNQYQLPQQQTQAPSQTFQPAQQHVHQNNYSVAYQQQHTRQQSFQQQQHQNQQPAQRGQAPWRQRQQTADHHREPDHIPHVPHQPYQQLYEPPVQQRPQHPQMVSQSQVPSGATHTSITVQQGIAQNTHCEYKQFTQAQRDRYKRVFDMFDINKDGVLESRELAAVSQIMGYRMPRDQVQVNIATLLNNNKNIFQL